ncbi:MULTISPECIES: hypothetical protein [Sphingomonadaceae]|uniref:Uncharacterized protein n=1 Tax=Rhizorhabdus wittichii TaxID=160791 RepID=A0A975D8J7_9SPHN|nr:MULTISPECIES: hypothetical protein [Sphingomonadaceae]QTH24783.1 hypothetical protein HRJ34_28325 [Rhizorhabdus wittichii]QUM74471.1 hypothetical protein ICN83_19275 [Sphingopyxis granuli]
MLNLRKLSRELASLIIITVENNIHFSVHSNEDRAFDALVQYIDENWIGERSLKFRKNEDLKNMVDKWVKETRAFYLISDITIENATGLHSLQ